MSGYTPMFDSVFHGTLCGRWPTLPVWMTILPMADKHGHIDLTYQAISALTGWPVDLLKQAITELMEPDSESRSEAEEGRRLVLIDPENRSWGWRVVNHGKYREKARKAAYDSDRTASGRDAERKKASRDVPTSPETSRALPLSDSDANTDSNKEKNPSASATPTRKPVSRERVDPEWWLDFKLAYPERSGDTGWRKAIRCARARLEEGHTPEEFIEGARRYANFCQLTGKLGSEFVKQASTFLGPDKHFLLPWKPPDVTPVVNLSPGEIVARAYEAKRNGGRVVADQNGSNGGGVEEPLRRVWPALPA